MNLPDFPCALEAQFTWGSTDSQSFCHALEAAYQEVVHWRSNCFKIPHGNVTTKLVLELARLFLAAGEGSTLECIALKAVLRCVHWFFRSLLGPQRAKIIFPVLKDD